MTETLTRQSVRVRYDVLQMVRDAYGRGWTKAKLIAAAQQIARDNHETPPASPTFYRFLTGANFSPWTASLIAAALEQPLERYVVVTSAKRRRAA